jgi:CopG family nickel-responsive transcriptional regulator
MSLDDGLAAEFESLIKKRGYENRSEAMRDILRHFIETNRLEESRATHCVASVSYVYTHLERQLAQRIADFQHEHHDLVVAAMHANLDHDFEIETLLLRGKVKDVQACADKLLAERGIRHGSINIIPVDGDMNRHKHQHSGSGAAHTHYRPKT